MGKTVIVSSAKDYQIFNASDIFTFNSNFCAFLQSQSVWLKGGEYPLIPQLGVVHPSSGEGGAASSLAVHLL